MRREIKVAGGRWLRALTLVAIGVACGGAPPGADPRPRGGADALRVTPDPGTITGPGSYYGRALALSGDLLAVSAYQQVDSAVYLYQRSGAGWRELQVIQGSNYYFARSLALDGNVLAIGDPGLGQVTVHRFDGTAFRLEATLTAPGGGDALFGHAVALGGGTLFVAEPGAREGGVVHLYVEQGWPPGWTPAGALTPAARAEWDEFGFALAASGRSLAVTVFGSMPPATVLFRRGTTGWVEEARLSDPEDDDYLYFTFGHKVALAGGLLVVNCACDDGEVYVYEWDGLAWRLATTLRGSAESIGYFGDGIATDGRRIVATAPGDPSGGVEDSGSATVFERGRAGWGPVARLEAPALVAEDWFGHAVAIDRGLVVIGAPGTEEHGGEVYTFQLQERGGGVRPHR